MGMHLGVNSAPFGRFTKVGAYDFRCTLVILDHFASGLTNTDLERTLDTMKRLAWKICAGALMAGLAFALTLGRS